MKKIKKKEQLFSLTQNFVDLVELCKTMRDCLVNGNDDLYTRTLLDTLLKAEKTTIDLRTYASCAMEFPKEKEAVGKIISEAADIKISCNENGVITIEMPIITPFKKLKTLRGNHPPYVDSQLYTEEAIDVVDKCNALTGNLLHALMKFKQSNEKLADFNYGSAVVVYTQCYAANIMDPDVDNYEYSQITNVIAQTLACGCDGDYSFAFLKQRTKSTCTRVEIYPAGHHISIGETATE